MKNPKARRDDLLLEELPAELLVYDQRTHRAHCLNASAAAVFRQADGSRTVAEIARRAGDELQAPFTEDLTWVALEALDEHDLLDGGLPVAPQGPRRRDLLTVGAVLLPLVLAITAPTPAFAQSVASTGAPPPPPPTGT